MVTREHQYPIPGFPLQKWEIRHFDPNLACLHFKLQSRFCFGVFQRLGGGYDDSVPEEVIKTTPSGDRTT